MSWAASTVCPVLGGGISEMDLPTWKPWEMLIPQLPHGFVFTGWLCGYTEWSA